MYLSKIWKSYNIVRAFNFLIFKVRGNLKILGNTMKNLHDWPKSPPFYGILEYGSLEPLLFCSRFRAGQSKSASYGQRSDGLLLPRRWFGRGFSGLHGSRLENIAENSLRTWIFHWIVPVVGFSFYRYNILVILYINYVIY